MNRAVFTATPSVVQFTQWLSDRCTTLAIRLDIKSSRFVRGGIRAELAGLDALLDHYRWRTKDSVSGDWLETQACLRSLGDRLRQAIDAGNEDEALQACHRILGWGGDRNTRVGARPFLVGLHASGQLTAYLRDARRAFALDSAVIDADRSPARKMNSMLTKVHALASADGLPIYDSRVAAAIAALVEMWRREKGSQYAALPEELAFPATMSDRTVLHLFDDAPDPGVMSYAPGKEGETAARWSSAKIRLGWLMAGVLAKAPGLFAREAERDRMHAFEASLFMIGYDVACLGANGHGDRVAAPASRQKGLPAPGVDENRLGRLRIEGLRRLREDHTDLPHKTISTLAQDNRNLTYAGSTDCGISGVWGRMQFAFDSEFLQELLADFEPGSVAGLGASVTGNVRPDTLGFWIDQHYPSRQRKIASALAAILVEEGLAERTADKTIRLRFV